MGLTKPMMGGVLQTAAYWADLEVGREGNAKATSAYRYGATAAYVYNLSKRTNVGGGVGYVVSKFNADETYKLNTLQAGVSLQHNF